MESRSRIKSNHFCHHSQKLNAFLDKTLQKDKEVWLQSHLMDCSFCYEKMEIEKNQLAKVTKMIPVVEVDQSILSDLKQEAKIIIDDIYSNNPDNFKNQGIGALKEGQRQFAQLFKIFISPPLLVTYVVCFLLIRNYL